MLHEVTADAGMGFCHVALPSILPWGYHGPLVVALDSSVLIDLQKNGNRVFNGEVPHGVDDVRADNLSGLTDLLHFWLLRDIRFIVTPRSLTDCKKPEKFQAFLDERLPAVEALAESLAFQFGDWNYPAPSELEVTIVGDVHGLPQNADRDLVLEAQGVGAHAFLTHDKPVLKKVKITGPRLAVLSSSELSAKIVDAGVQPMLGGTCEHDGCPYADGLLPAPDMGKWGGLLSVLGGEE